MNRMIHSVVSAGTRRAGALVASLVALPSAALAGGPAEQPIIDGAASEAGAYPATGALIRGRSLRCTATLIAPDVAITAAHCLHEGGWGDFSFTLDPNLDDSVDNLIPISVVHGHPGFEPQGDGIEYTRLGKRDDIGIVILDEPIESVPVEVLDREGIDLDVEELALCGYGRVSWAVAQSAGIKREAIVTPGAFTTWELEIADEGPQPCKGDSGAPLFVETPNGRRLVGLVSRALGTSHMCDDGALNTRVATYGDWIDEASRDRDEGGCSAGGPGGIGPALLAWLLLAFRRRAVTPRA